MTLLPVLDFNEIWLRSAGYIWHVFVVIWYLDKNPNKSIFWIECGNFWKLDKNYWNFIITSSQNVSHNLSKLLCGMNIMPMVFSSESRLKIKEINKTIDLGHRSLDGVPPQRWSSQGCFLSLILNYLIQ